MSSTFPALAVVTFPFMVCAKRAFVSSVLFRCLINCEQRIIIYMLHFQSNTPTKARGFVHTRVKSENMVQCGQRPVQILYETISVQNAAAQYDVFFSSSNQLPLLSAWLMLVARIGSYRKASCKQIACPLELDIFHFSAPSHSGASHKTRRWHSPIVPLDYGR